MNTTPIPLRAEHTFHTHDFAGLHYKTWVLLPDGTPVCSVYAVTADESKAHAALIVRAVNNHQRLIDALCEAKHYLNFHEETDSPHMQRIAEALKSAQEEV